MEKIDKADKIDAKAIGAELHAIVKRGNVKDVLDYTEQIRQILKTRTDLTPVQTWTLNFLVTTIELGGLKP